MENDPITIEAAVLGSMILEPMNIPLVRGIITSRNMFYYPNNGVVFQAIVDTYEEYENVDLVLLKNCLAVAGKLKTVGGVKYLVEIAESVPSAASWEYYTKILKEQHVRRQIARTAEDVMKLSQSHEPAGVAVQKIQAIAKRLVVEESDAGGVVGMDNISDVVGTFTPDRYMPTGIRIIDRQIRGIVKGEVVIVAARPSMGKTVMAMDFAINLAHDGHPTMFYSLEMTEVELKQRILCNQARITADKYIDKNLTYREQRRTEWAIEKMRTTPLYIDDSSRLTPDGFHAKLIQHKAKYGIEVAAIDYLTLMQSDGKHSNGYERVTEISNELKRIVKEEDVALILVCQLSRGPEQRSDKRPNMGDLRDSGAIEQNANIVMFIYRDDYYNPQDDPYDYVMADIIIPKVRRSKPVMVSVRFNGSITRFEDDDDITRQSINEFDLI